jgi:hypothetical protein
MFDTGVELKCLLTGGPGMIVMTHGGEAFREKQPGASILRLQAKAGREVGVSLGGMTEPLANGAALEVEARILWVRLDLLAQSFQGPPQFGRHTAKGPKGQIDGDCKTESQVESEVNKVECEQEIVHGDIPSAE